MACVCTVVVYCMFEINQNKNALTPGHKQAYLKLTFKYKI